MVTGENPQVFTHKKSVATPNIIINLEEPLRCYWRLEICSNRKATYVNTILHLTKEHGRGLEWIV
jgi:hypothetical protein